MDLTIILDDLINKFRLASGRLTDISLGLLTIFIAYEIVTELAIKRNKKPIMLIFDNIVKYGFLYWFIIDYQNLTQKLNESFIWLAGKAAGTSGVDPKSMPSDIIWKGLSELQNLSFKALEPKTYINVLLFIIGALVIIYLALQIFITFLEYTVVTSLIIVFIPLNAFALTKEWGSKVWSALFSQNVKIFVLTFLTNFIMVYLNEPMSDPSVEGALMYISGLLGLGFLASKTHEVVASIFTGTPSLGAPAPMQVAAAGMAVGRTAQAAKQIGGAGAQGMAVGFATGGIGGAVKGGMKASIDKAKEIRASKRG